MTFLFALIFALGGSSSARAALHSPALPTKANPNSVASVHCPPKPVSTLEMEACAGKRLLRLDREFNAKASILWSMLDAPSRRAFVRAHRSWLTHMTSWCEIGARRYLGGTASGVEASQCQVDATSAWLRDVRGMITFYCRGMAKAGRYRQCPHS